MIPSKEVATKANLAGLRAEIKADIAQLEVRLIWRLLGGASVLLGITIGLLKMILG